jgi:hypothetical protein
LQRGRAEPSELAGRGVERRDRGRRLAAVGEHGAVLVIAGVMLVHRHRARRVAGRAVLVVLVV